MNTATKIDRTAVQVYVGERAYMVNLDTEEVTTEHFMRSRGYRFETRRVHSERIKTKALLRASDKVHTE